MEMLTSRNNPRIKELVRLFESARDRRTAHLFVAEGERLCKDAALSNAEIVRVFITPSAQEKYPETVAMLSRRCSEIYGITDELARRVGDTESPQGVFCVCKMLDKNAEMVHINKESRVVVLENLQDPANMGAVFRSAEAFGLDGVILAGNCCDVYAPKAVRAGMGAVFRLNLLRAETGAEAARVLNRAGVSTFAAVAHGDAMPLTGGVLGKGCAVFIGNEGNGLTEQTIESCDHPLTIPMGGRAESLNAAAAASILIWEMVRHNGKSDAE